MRLPWKREKPLIVEDGPRVSYSEIRRHGSRELVGYIPDEVFESIVGARTGETTWIRKDESEAIRAHPQFIVAGPASRVSDQETPAQ